MNGGMRVPLQGQPDVGVPCQFLGQLRANPASFQQRNEGVPQGVEVGVEQSVGPFDCVEDARRFQVDLEHVGSPI